MKRETLHLEMAMLSGFARLTARECLTHITFLKLPFVSPATIVVYSFSPSLHELWVP